MRDDSAQGHGSWWTIDNTGIAAIEGDQLIRNYADARQVIRSGVEDVGEWSGQRMEGAALIVQTEQAVMMVGIGTREGRIDRKVSVSSDRRRFVHIERVVADQRDNARYLGDHEECHQAGAQTADRSYEPHGLRCSARILGETGASGCGKRATVRNFSQVKDHTHRLRWGPTFNVDEPLPFHAGGRGLARTCRSGMSAFTASLGG
jgi:hypothetical protein